MRIVILLILGLLGLLLVIVVLGVVVGLASRGKHTVPCPKCGKMSPRSKFCPHCGAKSVKQD